MKIEKSRKKLVIITSSELRHEFFRKYVASFDSINVLKTYCESQEKSLVELVKKEEVNTLRQQHLAMRAQTEKDFFELFCQQITDKSNPEFIKKGDINLEEKVREIAKLNPDIIVSYGCSLIKPPLIELFKGRFINIHLGLSPYYRGSGTNFWPFVNKEPEYVGVTFMYIDPGVDTGEVIHQLRPVICPGDNIHQIGNRLIGEMAKCLVKIIDNFAKLEKLTPLPFAKSREKYYRQKDFVEESVKIMYENFSQGLITEFLAQREQREARVPILQNKVLL